MITGDDTRLPEDGMHAEASGTQIGSTWVDQTDLAHTIILPPPRPRAEALRHRFTYHPPKEGQQAIYQELRDAALALALLIQQRTPESREQHIALTHVETAIMFANAAIARHT